MINTSSSGSSLDELIDEIPSAEISRSLPHAIASGLITYVGQGKHKHKLLLHAPMCK